MTSKKKKKTNLQEQRRKMVAAGEMGRCQTKGTSFQLVDEYLLGI